MAQDNARNLRAHRFARSDSIAVRALYGTLDNPRPCAFDRCKEERFAGLPVCFGDALMIGKFIRDLYEMDETAPIQGCEVPLNYLEQVAEFVERKSPKLKATSVVYYLMLSPTTVKIGTTINLRQRMSGLRTEAQYIVALEYGGGDLERQRHVQFAADRREVRREDFHLSDALKQHIDSLIPQRDEILAAILAAPRR